MISRLLRWPVIVGLSIAIWRYPTTGFEQTTPDPQPTPPSHLNPSPSPPLAFTTSVLPDAASTAADAATTPSLRGAADVRQFGARGDGMHDDGEAIAKALQAGHGSLVFPPGVYRITRTLEVRLDERGPACISGSSSATLVMAGPGPAIRLIGTHSGTADPSTMKASTWTRQRTPTLEGLAIAGDHPEADGVEASGTMQLTMHRVTIHQVRHALRLIERNRNLIVSDCHLYHNRGAGIFYDHVNLHQSNIVGCHISYNEAGGIVVLGGEVRNIHISGCDIESNMSAAHPDAANVLLDSRSGSVAEVSIVGCTIQHQSRDTDTANIRVFGNGSGARNGTTDPIQWGHITIGQNILSDVQTNIDLHHTRGVTIVGNTMWQGYRANLVAEDCSQIVISSNVCERNPLYGSALEAKNGVILRRCNDCTLQGLHLHRVLESEAALLLEDCSRLQVVACTVLDSDNVGMLLRNVTRSHIAQCLIRDDRDPMHRGSSLRVVGGHDNTFHQNVLVGDTNLEGPPEK
ncbi:MAG: hypothetical protein RIS70_1103 [Planctomycetota bacterium]